jgi:Spy/CpxP family protein refolding chaperone
MVRQAKRESERIGVSITRAVVSIGGGRSCGCISDQRDDAGLSKSYRKMSDLRQQMFDLWLRAQTRINAVLTKEQRDKMKRG